jgi:cleavage and polyadenylation specificity factor subunit 1
MGPAGKWSSRVEISSASIAAIQPSARLLVKDTKTNTTFLVDTGACISVIPPRKEDLTQVEDINLTAANGSRIATYGERLLTLDFGLHQPLQWVFTIAEVQQPILGADFLAHYNIIVNMANKTLSHHTNSVSATLHHPTEHATRISSTQNNITRPYADLLQQYPAITAEEPAPTDTHKIVHHIITTGPPTHSKVRKLGPIHYHAAKEEFQKMIDTGIVRPSSSPWASPLHLVPKKPNAIRPVGDYRALNRVTKKDSYSLPLLQSFSQQLHGKQIFSKVDLRSAYHQIPINPDDIEKTAVITPFGLFEFTKMNFGLSGASQTFQRFIDTVTRKTETQCPDGTNKEVNLFAYIDDILVASETEEEHLQDLEALFKRLAAHGLKLNQEKCDFGKTELTFLGHRINSEGITPLPEKVEAISKMSRPTTYKSLRRFTGMVNFYHRFIPNAAEKLAPLHSLHSGNHQKRKNALIKWNEEANTAFQAAKDALVNATRLYYPKPNAETCIAADASNIAVGAVLQNKIDDKWRPIAFFSRKLTPAERKYSTFGRELLAAYLAVRHFRHMIEGTYFHLATDHKPLVGAMHKAAVREIPRETRHLNFISIFTNDIRHIAGEDNTVADALSRGEEDQHDADDDAHPFCFAILCDSETEKLQQEQECDTELQDILANKSTTTSTLTLQKVDGVHCHILNGIARPFIPKSMRRSFFQRVHELSHPGVRTTQKQLTERYVWPHMNKDIRAWTTQCIPCQRAKIHRHNKAPIQSIPTTGGKFSQVHLDLVGPLPINKGQRYLMTAVDRYTRWPEAIPIPNATAETVADAFITHWISRYGVPESITTDRGAQFESHLWRQLTNLLGATKVRTTSYHPQSNGIVERFHRQLKASLKAQPDPEQWVNRLPFTLLGVRTALKPDIGYSSAEMLYGSNLRLPGDLLVKNTQPCTPDLTQYTDRLKETMRRVAPAQSRNRTQTKSYMDPKLETATHVFVRIDAVRTPLQAPYQGPFQILEKRAKFFKININGRIDNVSVDRLKAAHVDEQFLTIHRPRVTMVPHTTAAPRPISRVAHTTETAHQVNRAQPNTTPMTASSPKQPHKSPTHKPTTQNTPKPKVAQPKSKHKVRFNTTTETKCTKSGRIVKRPIRYN